MSTLTLSSPGPLLMLSSSLFLCSGAFYFDWSETHVLNPRWPPHAKFHNGQTMTSSLLYLVLQGYLLSRSGGADGVGKGAVGIMAARREDLWIAALVGSLYTVSFPVGSSSSCPMGLPHPIESHLLCLSYGKLILTSHIDLSIIWWVLPRRVVPGS